MENKPIDIVMFNMSAYTDWQAGIANRNMHVLHNLLNDPRVRKIVSIDTLPFTWKRALKYFLFNILNGVQGRVISRTLTHRLVAVRDSEIERTGYKTANADNNHISYKLFVYTTITSAWSEERAIEELQHQLERLDLKNIVVWSYSPMFVNCFGRFNEKLSVFDAVDNWLEHGAYQKIIERLKHNYQVIRFKTNIIFTTAERLVNFFERGKGVYFIANGVKLSDYNLAPKLVPRDLAALPRPIIGYVGTIESTRFDLDLVRYLAEKNPKYSFVIIGWVWSRISRLAKYKLGGQKNIHLLGRKHVVDLPAFMSQFSLGIIPHLQNEFSNYTNSMKVYEYLAAGLPVVATPSAGLTEFKDHIHIASSPEDFNLSLQLAIKDNSFEKSVARKAAVKGHDWSNRVGAMLERVFNLIDLDS